VATHQVGRPIPAIGTDNVGTKLPYHLGKAALRHPNNGHTICPAFSLFQGAERENLPKHALGVVIPFKPVVAGPLVSLDWI